MRTIKKEPRIVATIRLTLNEKHENLDPHILLIKIEILLRHIGTIHAFEREVMNKISIEHIIDQGDIAESIRKTKALMESLHFKPKTDDLNDPKTVKESEDRIKFATTAINSIIENMFLPKTESEDEFQVKEPDKIMTSFMNKLFPKATELEKAKKKLEDMKEFVPKPTYLPKCYSSYEDIALCKLCSLSEACKKSTALKEKALKLSYLEVIYICPQCKTKWYKPDYVEQIIKNGGECLSSECNHIACKREIKNNFYFRCPKCNYNWYEPTNILTIANDNDKCPECQTHCERILYSTEKETAPEVNKESNKPDYYYRCPNCNNEWHSPDNIKMVEANNNVCPNCNNLICDCIKKEE